MQICTNSQNPHENNENNDPYLPFLTIKRLRRENKQLKEEVAILKMQLRRYQKKKVEMPDRILRSKEEKQRVKELKIKARQALAKLLATDSPLNRKEIRDWNKNAFKLELKDLAAVIRFLEKRKIAVKDKYKDYWHFTRL